METKKKANINNIVLIASTILGVMLGIILSLMTDNWNLFYIIPFCFCKCICCSYFP